MTWRDIVPDGKAKIAPKPVTLRIAKLGKRFAPRLTLVLRADAAMPLRLYQPGRHVLVRVNDTTGQVKLLLAAGVTAKGFPLKGVPGKRSSEAPSTARLIIPAASFGKVPAEGLPETALEWTMDGSDLVVTLPAWQGAPWASAAKPAPFKGVAASSGLGNGIGAGHANRRVAA